MNYTISQTTQYQPDEIMKKIRSKMDYKGYEVINYTDRNLTFKQAVIIGPYSNLWYSKLYKGKFDITDTGDSHVVRLQYQVFPVVFWVIFTLAIGVALVISLKTDINMVYSIVVFSVLLLFNLLTRHFTAKNMLRDILV
jgi:hypothetical protein